MNNFVVSWAGRLCNTPSAIEALGTLRLVPNIEATLSAHAGNTAEANEKRVWVRGARLEARDEKLIRRIPWEQFYEVFDGNRIRQPGRILPDGILPDISNEAWNPLARFLQPTFPAGPLPGRAPAPVNIELRPDSALREVSLIEATAHDWLAFANMASEIRLRHLIWALDDSRPQTVLIRGTPLPPVPGKRFVEEGGVIVPAGYWWWPAVSPEALRRSLGVTGTELILLDLANQWSLIPRTAWLPGKRSTVRLVFSQNASLERSR